jgi:hypothetical protein
MPKTVNYTKEQEVQLEALYNQYGNENLDEIAREMGKSPRSVRSKLVHMGKYEAPEKPASTKKDEGPDRKTMVRLLVEKTGREFKGLERCNKSAIEDVLSVVAEFEYRMTKLD